MAVVAELAVLLTGALTVGETWIGLVRLIVGGAVAFGAAVVALSTVMDRSMTPTLAVSSDFQLALSEREVVRSSPESAWPAGGMLELELQQRFSQLATSRWSLRTAFWVFEFYLALAKGQRPRIFHSSL